jgi:predicted dehydrogenase
MTAERFRVAIVGLGLWGSRAHLPAFAARDDVKVVALADQDLARAREQGDKYGVARVFTDPYALFRHVEGLDAVVLAVPDDTHRDLTLAALDAGCNVFCEKPIAYDVEQGEEMLAAAEARNRVTKIGFMFRFSPVLRQMKMLIDEGFVGDVQLFESLTLNAQFIDPQRPLHWKMQRQRANGGVFVEYGSHTIDLAHWLAGPIQSVVAHGVTLVPERPTAGGGRASVDVDDACSWIATLANGGQAIFRVGWTSQPVGGAGIRVYGSRGSLGWQLDPTSRRSEQLLGSTVDEPEPRVLFDFTPPFDPRIDAGTFPIGLSFRYNSGLVESFVDDLRAGRSSSPSFADGLAAQRVLRAIRTSLDERRWTDV